MNSDAWVLVTGGAKRIGAFLNQEFAKSGKNIVLHYNHSETAAIALKATIRSTECQGGLMAGKFR